MSYRRFRTTVQRLALDDCDECVYSQRASHRLLVWVYLDCHSLDRLLHPQGPM